MWRLMGLLGRALPRLLGPDLWGVTPKTTSPTGTQAASSTLLVPEPSFQRSGPRGSGTSKGPRNHGWKEAFHWMSARVSPNTLWDAVSWGTLAVLALQLARQLHFQASLPVGPWQLEHCSWRSPLDHFLSSPQWPPHFSLRRHILPLPHGPVPGHPGRRGPRQGPEEPLIQSQSGPLHSPSETASHQDFSEEGAGDLGFLYANLHSQTKAAQPQPLGKKKEQEPPKALPLEEAAISLQQLFQLSVSIAFNFLGTENIKNGDYAAAFSYFQKAADRGYSKAQYNMGLCHEHGRGTPRDLSKAQAFLGVFFTKVPYLDEQRAVKYLWLAANNGDSQSRYHLGICYEKGLGVPRSLEEAVRCYQQSAAVGNQLAQERLRALFPMKAAAPGPSNLAITGLKSFSSPSLCSLNTLLTGASCLPHASSTGSLGRLCRSGHVGAGLGAPSRTIPTLERSLVRLGFG
ncbi:death ligand signal enhancer isoform X1 [Ochotona princeps]|uniref:death ligand signal enhancer isoform X1 n=1 Tax=Ochotona princeps TaxID=9978 RepID=UPI00271544D6|nr:death ligand signal enhancer isoform X1 [Ochotona princeps]